MATALNFKLGIDLPKWKPLSNPIAPVFSNSGFICDYRNNEDRHPFIYYNQASSFFNSYNVKSDEWASLTAGFVGFTSGFFMSAQGPRGTITTTGNNTSFTLSTALPASVGSNQLANRGDGRGFKVRIIGNGGIGSSGKVEERYVISNTSGTTPTINIDTPFSFTPATGDAYEFLSGRLFVLGSSNSANQYRYYDVLTNSISGNLSTTNLPASPWVDSNLVGLDELLVPYDRNPGEGFLGLMISTGTTSTTLIGQASGGDAGVVVNQYRNFQIRIIQDFINPTAVGQRRNITSHTAGPSPIYTVSAWSVTPSSSAIYVIENNGDRIIAWLQGSTATFTYTISTNAWDANGTFSVRPDTPQLGMMSHQAFSIEPDSASPPNARQSFIYSIIPNNTIDVFDISGATTGTWAATITYGNANNNLTFLSASSSTHDPATNQGKYIYINRGISNSPSQRFCRFDMKNRVMETGTFLRIGLPTNLGTSSSIKWMAYTVFIDGSTKISYIFFSPTDLAIANKLFFSLPIIE